jgi:transposase
MRFGCNASSDDVATNDSTIRAAHDQSKRDLKEKRMEKELSEDYAALVGMDWADRSHQFSLSYPGCQQRQEGEVKHKPESLMDWITSLRHRFPKGSIAICMEQFRSGLAYFLMQFDFIVLYLVNPITVKRYREAFYPSGAKDDPRDSEVLLDLLEKHRNHLRIWEPETAEIRKLDLLCRHRRSLVDKITALTNELTAHLKAYYPQAFELVGELDTLQCCDFLEKWPNLESAKKAKRSEIEKFYKSHNCRSSKKIQERIKLIQQAIPITSDQAICSVYQLTAQSIVAQLRPLLNSLQKFNEELGKMFNQHPEKHLYEKLPGAGSVLAPRLAAAFGLNRSKFNSAAELQCFSGVAPVTEKSGNKSWVHWRFACPKFLRQTFVEFANHSRNKSIWAAAYYQDLRKRGKKHQAALRVLAYKWIRILFKCWKDGKPYDESIYLKTLEKRRAPLAKLIAQNA